MKNATVHLKGLETPLYMDLMCHSLQDHLALPACDMQLQIELENHLGAGHCPSNGELGPVAMAKLHW